MTVVADNATPEDELSTTGAEKLFTTAPLTCAKPGCDLTLPEKGEPGYHRLRKYCDAHQPSSSPGAAKRRMTNPDEPAPTRVVNNNFVIKPAPAKSTKATGDLAKVEEGATELLNLIPMVLAMFGDDVCPPEIAKAVPLIAHQLAVLAKFHPALKKVFAGTESTGEMMAWLSLVVVISPVIVTVLAHHNLISGKIAERVAFAASMGGLLATAVEPDAAD